MTIIHVPSRGENDPHEEIAEVFVRGALPEHATVPLTVYVDGERHIIGEATIEGGMISAILGDNVAEEVMDLVMGRPEEARFSLGFSREPDPFNPKKYVF